MTHNAASRFTMSTELGPEDRRGLEATLKHVLATDAGGRRRIGRIDCHPSIYRSSCFVDDIDVRFDDGSAIELVAKPLHWDAMCADAHRARLRSLWNEEREHVTYEAILSTADVNSARYFGSYLSSAGVRYLLLERVGGQPLWQYGEFEAWREAARWLARLHVRIGSEAVGTSDSAAHLLRYDRPFYDAWMRRARECRVVSHPAVMSLSGPYRRVVDWLLSEPIAFLHGEFYSSNILIERIADRFNVRPVDWEMAALGPPSIDLACLLAGQWTDEERADGADAYYLELAAQGGRVPPRERYLRALDYCLIHLSVRNLGWSGDWSPPPGRGHDWLAEALRLCEKWEL